MTLQLMENLRDGYTEGHHLIQGRLFTGKGESEGQKMLLLQTDVLLKHKVLQRLCNMVKQLQRESRSSKSEEISLHSLD